MWVYRDMWNWIVDHNGTVDGWATTGTLVATALAAVAAFLSYRQMKAHDQAILVPTLTIDNTSNIKCEVYNHGSVAKNIDVKISIPKKVTQVELRHPILDLPNGVDVLPPNESFTFSALKINDRNYFQNKHQLWAMAMKSSTDITEEKRQEFADLSDPIRVSLTLIWRDKSTRKRQSETYELNLDYRLWPDIRNRR